MPSDWPKNDNNLLDLTIYKFYDRFDRLAINLRFWLEIEQFLSTIAKSQIG